MVIIPGVIKMILQPGRSARCFGMCWTVAAAANGKQRWMRGIRLTNTIWLLQKWTPLFYKARKPGDGGCSCRTGVLLPAAIKIIYLPAATRYRRDGCGRKREVDTPV